MQKALRADTELIELMSGNDKDLVHMVARYR